jgi:V/A-type H+-transporting ATPase subunit C
MARRDYANARVQGMRGRLLGTPGIRELLARGTLEARLAYLMRTDYGEALGSALRRHPIDPLRTAEQVLFAQPATDALRIDAWLAGDLGRAVVRAFHLLEDAASVKILLRGLARGAPGLRLVSLCLPTPGLDAAALRALAGHASPEALAEELRARGSPLGAPLAAALLLPGGKALLPLEVALDRAAAAAALAAAAAAPAADRAILVDALALRTDLANAATLLKLDEAAATAEALFLAGGSALGADALPRLAAAPLARRRAVIGAMLRTPLGRAAAAAAAQHLDDPLRGDQILRVALERALHAAARALPLSIAVPLAYLTERAGEVRRLRLALRGAEYGLPAAELLDLLEAA